MSSLQISICIPAYKRVDFLHRLLSSIRDQIFKYFEVIVTDDSASKEIEALCETFKDKFEIHYFRNSLPLGTPENWNEAIRRAKGKWLKLMHDDDWFSSPESLLRFAEMIPANPGAGFIYSAYENIYEESGRSEIVRISQLRKRELEKNAATLFSSNVIGPPSVTLIRNDVKEVYDKAIKWVVDIDYYMRVLKHTAPVYIDEPLIKVGINKEQVTKLAFRNPSVEIPENFYLLEKIGVSSLKNILVYDAWWRIVRNLGINSAQMIKQYGYDMPVHPVILSMVKWQRKFPKWVLRMGLFSKWAMGLHFVLHRNRLINS